MPRLSLEQLTADQLRSRAETLGTNMESYAPRTTDDVTQTIDNRPDVGALYEKLNVLNRKPLDYSGITAVNKARGEQGDREWLGGLAMQMMGGKTIAPAGKHVFEQALAKQTPIRPNAADVGWTNPEDGSFVENPQTARSQEEKIITGRIDALIKEQESKARIAIAQGNAVDAQNAKANAEQLRTILASLALQNNNNKAVQIQFIGDKANKGTTKPIPASQQRDLEGKVEALGNLQRSVDTWDDKYAGALGPLSNARVAVSQTLGGLDNKFNQERANWWKDFGMYQTLPMRHKLFGSALTANEQKAWDDVQALKPGNKPETVTAALNKMLTLAKEKHSRLVTQLNNEGKNTEAYADAIDLTPTDDGGGAAAELAKRRNKGKKAE